MKWTMAHIEKLLSEGKIKGYTVMNKPETEINKGKSGIKLPEREPVGLAFIKRLLEKQNIVYTTEYRFHHERRFRFDIALQPLKIAIEYEGVMSKKSRHTTNSGYTRDAEKYNLAQRMGWQVYRYTTLNYKNFENDLKDILK